jgi:flagellar protein FlgJ
MDAVGALPPSPSIGASASTQRVDPAMMQAAQDFEALFVQQLVKAMRQSSEAMGTGILDGQKTKIYRDMLDEQLARAMAQRGGLGIANFVLGDMVRRNAAPTKKDSSAQLDVPMVKAEDE